MTRRWILTGLILLLLPGALRADEVSQESTYPNWFLGLKGGNTWLENRDVFGRFTLEQEVEERTEGGLYLLFGRRFGDRFLLGFSAGGISHGLEGTDGYVADVEAFITGTVLFRQHHKLQPFVRGGFGGAGQILEMADDAGTVTVFGTGTVAGGGLQVMLGRHFSLELEGVATFANYLQVEDDSKGDLWGGGDWQVRTSSWGTRVGISLAVWF